MDAIKRNNCTIRISAYLPTMNVLGKYDSKLNMISFTEKVKGALDIFRFCRDIEMHPWKVMGVDKIDISCWINRYDDYVKDL